MPNTIVGLDRDALEFHPGGAHAFSMRGSPVLRDGKWMRTLATTDDLWLHVKIYAAGGERRLHRHTEEDHSFVVLQGAATFEFDDGARVQVGPFDGVLIPRGARYCFTADCDENLVMLRIGAGHAPGPRTIADLPYDPGLQGTAERTDTTDPASYREPPLVVEGKTWPRQQ